MEKIISIKEAYDRYDANVFFSIFKIACFVQIKSIEDGVVDLHGFKYQKFGLIFGDNEEGDFVSLEKEPKVYPYYTRMFNNEYYSDDKPGIYVANLLGFDINAETMKLYEKYKDLAIFVENWYFDVYLNNEMKKYSFNPEELDGIDKKIKEVTKTSNSDNNIIKFRKK